MEFLPRLAFYTLCCRVIQNKTLRLQKYSRLFLIVFFLPLYHIRSFEMSLVFLYPRSKIELREPREHLRRKHNPVQCDRCCRIFDDGPDRATRMLELKKHHQLPDPCKLNSSGSKEGISDFQWATLDKKRSKKNIQRLSSVDKWNEIWTVLFPGVSHPQTPCNHTASDYFQASRANRLRV